MFDLETDVVYAHWEGLSPELGTLFRAVEQTENWTVDRNPAVAERLRNFCHLLDQPGQAARLAEARFDDLAFLLVHLSSSKAFRVVSWLDEQHNQLGSRILAQLLRQDVAGVYFNISEPLFARVLVQRLQVIQNIPYFKQLLDPALLRSIQGAVDAHREEMLNHA
jgi:hypothetical protein